MFDSLSSVLDLNLYNPSLHFIIPIDVGTQRIQQGVLFILDNQFRYHQLGI